MHQTIIAFIAVLLATGYSYKNQRDNTDAYRTMAERQLESTVDRAVQHKVDEIKAAQFVHLIGYDGQVEEMIFSAGAKTVELRLETSVSPVDESGTVTSAPGTRLLVEVTAVQPGTERTAIVERFTLEP